MLPSRRLPLLGRPVVDVAVGVLRAPDGSVLVAERKAGKDAAGFWELPGGQVDPGESPVQAAARELLEEVGVRALELAPWRVYEHDFPAKRVRLHWFHVRRWSGEPKGREGQRVAWVDPARPTVGPLLPSNELALATLALPELVAVARVNRAPGAPDELLARIPSLAAGGLRLLIVRAPELGPAQRVQLTRRLRQLRRGTGLRLLLSGTALEARQAGACGLHSSAAALAGLVERPPTRLWAVSAHNARDLERAAALGADVALVSPVLPTASHPGDRALGWDGLRALAAASPLPVYAQGGLGPGDIDAARSAGALGVAVDVSRLSGVGRQRDHAVTGRPSDAG
ncbi:MAG TPA: Nudix family hydrolase [Acidimicrobiales bacterium]|jgi:8-oxo-dGTP diphosphatase|nr:Nudix family hydrolase [Acidimicrobiales bacterium]